MFYTEADKLIYTSPTGAKYDPLALHRGLVLNSGGQLNDWLAAWGSPEADDVTKAAAEAELVRVCRLAFGLLPFDKDDGVVDGVALGVLDDYLRWLDSKK